MATLDIQLLTLKIGTKEFASSVFDFKQNSVEYFGKKIISDSTEARTKPKVVD